MNYSENLLGYYQSRKSAPDWAAWARDNARAAEALEYARRLAEEMGLLDG